MGEHTVDRIVEWVADSWRERGRDPAISSDTFLLDDDGLDSMQLLHLLHFVEETYGLAIDVDELHPDNFATPAAVAAMVDRLRQASGRQNLERGEP